MSLKDKVRDDESVTSEMTDDTTDKSAKHFTDDNEKV